MLLVFVTIDYSSIQRLKGLSVDLRRQVEGRVEGGGPTQDTKYTEVRPHLPLHRNYGPHTERVVYQSSSFATYFCTLRRHLKPYLIQ